MNAIDIRPFRTILPLLILLGTARAATAQPTGACCAGSACSIIDQASCLKEGFTWLGPDTTCAQCPQLPACPVTGVLFSQPPSDPASEPPASTSEFSATLRCYENFSGVAGAISAVTWWGLDLRRVGNHFEECAETDNTFQVTFFRDGGGIPGTQVCSYTLLADRTPLNIHYRGFELNQYHVVLPSPCILTHGWISIVGLGELSCWFLWMASPVGDGQHYCSGCAVGLESPDLSVCLHGTAGGITGACCNDANGSCNSGVAIENCLAPNLRFTANTACSALDPPCGAPMGACCFELSGCSFGLQADCAAVGGIWQGPNSVCGNCPCRVDCPPGAISEGEPICSTDYVDLVNAGCDRAPFRAVPVFFGDVICGHVGVYQAQGQSATDRDWFEITIPSPTRLSIEAYSESRLRCTLIDGANGCPGQVAITGTQLPCQPLLLDTFVFTPGKFWIVLEAFGSSDSSACGAAYRLRLPHPVGCPRGDLTFDDQVDGDDVQQFVNCILTGATSPGDCVCADMDGRDGLTPQDVTLFVARLLAG